ncbi:FMN-binding protein [Sphaerochaeta sp.]|jgi:uncharacterized protein with FMN-binding domain
MWWIIILIIGLAIIIALGVVLLMDGPSRQEAMQLAFAPIDFSHLKDGTYRGEYRGTKSHLRDTQVEVLVKEGNVVSVMILKGAVDAQGKPVKLTGNKTLQEVFSQVLQTKSLEVDAISGATITTKTHLKALEQALLKAEATD